MRKKKYDTKEWTRIDASVDGKKLVPATQNYFFGEKERRKMSKNEMIYRGKTIKQKSSGLLIATGAGSTGWYNSESGDYFPKGNIFPRTEKKAVFFLTGRYRYQSNVNEIFTGELLPGEEIILYSSNDGQGIVWVDSWEEYDFSRGRKAEIRLSDDPLKVIIPILSK